MEFLVVELVQMLGLVEKNSLKKTSILDELSEIMGQWSWGDLKSHPCRKVGGKSEKNSKAIFRVGGRPMTSDAVVSEFVRMIVA